MPSGTPNVVVARTPAKHWASSRTLICNAIAMGLLTAESQLHVLQPLLPVNVYAAAAFALPVINAALRLVTTAPLTITSPQEQP